MFGPEANPWSEVATPDETRIADQVLAETFISSYTWLEVTISIIFLNHSIKMSDEVKTENGSEHVDVNTGTDEKKTDGTPVKAEKIEEVNGSEPTDLQKKIIRQIEYYFSDYALPKDKFLQEQIKQDDGWVPLTVMTKFKRLADLTKNHQAILDALKKSTSGLMEVNEGSEKIRRSKDKPLPEDTEENKLLMKTRTVYCKGFPRQSTTIDKVLEFFNGFEGAENVKMRYISDKEEKSVFKGSLTVSFSSKELAEKFMGLDEVKYNDHSLLRQWFVDWEKEKEEQFKNKKNKAKKQSQDSDDKKNGETKENEKIKLARNAVLKLVDLPEKLERDEIKKAFASYPADIAHIEGPADNTAFVRLRGENDGKTVLGKLEEGKMTILDTVVGVTLLEGEEEDEYLKKVEERINSAVANKGGRGRHGGRGRGRGRGRGGWRGHKRSGSPSGLSGNKKMKSE